MRKNSFTNFGIQSLGRVTALSFVGLVGSGLLAPNFLQADAQRDYYSQQATRRYFNTPQNARTFGMAGSSIQTSSDSSSVTGNPAGLGLMQGGDLSLSYGRNTFSGRSYPGYENIEQDEDSLRGLLALPLGPVADGLPEFGNIGFGWNGYDSDSNDALNTESEGNEIYGAYAKALSDTLSIGYSLGYFDDELKGDSFNYDSSANFRHTLGVQHVVSDEISWGTSIFVGHGDYDATFDGATSESSLNQYGIEVGVGYRMGMTLLTSGLGYSYYDTDGRQNSSSNSIVIGGDESGHGINFSVGAEQTISDWLKLRAGYRYNGLNDYTFERADLSALDGSAKYNAFTAGVGFLIPLENHYVSAVHLDYGAEYRAIGDGDWKHVATVSVPFDLCEPLV
jgi:opacity protein-like surface antigen